MAPRINYHSKQISYCQTDVNFRTIHVTERWLSSHHACLIKSEWCFKLINSSTKVEIPPGKPALKKEGSHVIFKKKILNNFEHLQWWVFKIGHYHEIHIGNRSLILLCDPCINFLQLLFIMKSVHWASFTTLLHGNVK